MAAVDADTQSTHSQDLANVINEQVGQTNAGIAKGYTSGNAEARGLLAQPENFNQGLSFGDRATSDAIKGKYMQSYAHKESQLNNKMLQSADQDHVRKLQNAANMAGEEVELNKQKEILRHKKAQAARAARGAVLGQVLGITAGVVAGVYTGGAGAGAGYMAGNAAGNAIGGAN